MKTWHSSWKPPVVVILWVALVLGASYAAFKFVDPLPPHRFSMAAGIARTSYDDFARQYARTLARNGVALDVRNFAGGVEHFDALRDPASGVQAAITTFGFTVPQDVQTLFSLGGISDSPIFIFYRSEEPIQQFAQLRGKRLSAGMPTTTLRPLMLQVLEATGGFDASTRLVDLDYAESVEALITGKIDAAMLPMQLGDPLLQRAFDAPGVRLMNVSQAEALSKTIPGLKHVVLWRGIISLSRDIPASDFDLLAIRNRVLVRKDLHPALQYLLLQAMRELHWRSGPFNRLGEFPAEQPGDLPLSPTAEAFYRSGPTLWQRYTSYWLSSLLNRIVFFVLPFLAVLVPVIGFAPRFYRWLHVRRIDELHRALGNLARAIDQSGDPSLLAEHQARMADIEFAVQSLKVARPFEVDLHRLRIHLRMVQEDMRQKAAAA